MLFVVLLTATPGAPVASLVANSLASRATASDSSSISHHKHGIPAPVLLLLQPFYVHLACGQARHLLEPTPKAVPAGLLPDLVGHMLPDLGETKGLRVPLGVIAKRRCPRPHGADHLVGVVGAQSRSASVVMRAVMGPRVRLRLSLPTIQCSIYLQGCLMLCLARWSALLHMLTHSPKSRRRACLGGSIPLLNINWMMVVVQGPGRRRPVELASWTLRVLTSPGVAPVHCRPKVADVLECTFACHSV